MNIRQELRRLSQGVLVSSATGAGMYVAGVLVIDAWYRRTPRLFTIASAGVFFAFIVALTGMIVQWPILRAMRTFHRRIVLLTGALLGAVPFAGTIMLFRDADEDPSTVLEFARFWLRVPGEFLVPFLPMAIAGAMLGWFATLRSEPPPKTRNARFLADS
jgi:hypothetical protein